MDELVANWESLKVGRNTGKATRHATIAGGVAYCRVQTLLCIILNCK